jgi:pantetheine-phosphate adenylyltransferase
MKRAVYPGSFDPVTLGHLDIIKRSAKIVDELIVGVLNNKSKTPLFPVENRVKMLEEVVKDIPNVKVMSFDGLLVDFAKKLDAQIIVRGLRAVTDFEYELQMSQTNLVLNKDVDTIFFNTSLEYSYLSSSTVKEAAFYGADISGFVPESVVNQVYDKIKEKKKEKRNE